MAGPLIGSLFNNLNDNAYGGLDTSSIANLAASLQNNPAFKGGIPSLGPSPPGNPINPGAPTAPGQGPSLAPPIFPAFPMPQNPGGFTQQALGLAGIAPQMNQNVMTQPGHVPSPNDPRPGVPPMPGTLGINPAANDILGRILGGGAYQIPGMPPRSMSG